MLLATEHDNPTASDIIAYDLKLRRKGSIEMRATVHEVIELVDFEVTERRFQNQLLGGEQQRVALAISGRIVVKSRGQTEQIGSPQDGYALPRTVYVVGFVGKTHRLPGVVSEATTNTDTVNSLGRTFRVATPPGATFQAVHPVNLLIQSEAVNLHPARSVTYCRLA